MGLETFQKQMDDELKKATKTDAEKEAEWRVAEEAKLASRRTDEELRNLATVASVYSALAQAREANDPQLLEPLKELWASDGVFVNVRLANTIFPYAEPTTGGDEFVSFMKDFWFGRWDVEAKGDLFCEPEAMGPVVMFRGSVNMWVVRRNGRKVSNADPAADPMQETSAVHFTPQGKIQQWLYYMDAGKKESFIYAFSGRGTKFSSKK